MVHQMAAHHLKRLACLYVRQSTLQQVFENTESTARQYALREQAVALGWAEERILVIRTWGIPLSPLPTALASNGWWQKWYSDRSDWFWD